jgi:CheY-like chemotaxis protein
LSAALVIHAFEPPQLSWAVDHPRTWLSVSSFVGMGALFGVFHERRRAANRPAAETLAAALDRVLTDQNMPGFELAYRLQRIRPDLPVILTTGFSPDLTPEKARGFGVAEVLLKPVIVHRGLNLQRPTLT